MSKKSDYDPNELFEAGGIFLFFDFPLNSEFGIDYTCWRTAENFKGVKMIPPGIHYIYYSCSDKYGQLSLRNGFFVDFRVKQIVAKKWNKQKECVEDYELSEEQRDNFSRSKREFDKFLGAYPYDEYKRWLSLSNHISLPFLNLVVPETGIITSEAALVGQSFVKKRKHSSSEETRKDTDLSNLTVDTELLKAPGTIKEAEDRLPEMTEIKSAKIRFTQVDESYPRGSSVAEITRHSIDTSYTLEQMLERRRNDLNLARPDPIHLLSELQFSFICFLIGQCHDAFEQWKCLIRLLCNAQSLISKYPSLYVDLVQVLYFQIKELPDDFFTDILTSNNFLIVHLHNLFDNINDETKESASTLNKLREKCDKFKSYLQEKFQFDFETEPDEYSPVVVESV